MCPDKKAGAIIRGPECCQHFEKVIKRGGFSMNHAACPFSTGKFREHLRDVIGYGTFLNIRTPKDMPDQDIKVKSAGYPKTPPAFKQGVEESFVVEDQIARLLVGEQFHQTLSIPNFLAKHRKNKVDVFGRE